MTDNRTTELLPCPFCGGEAEPHEVAFPYHYWDVWCDGECFDHFCEKHTEAEAIAAWNARAERTCEIESSYINDFTVKNMCWYEFEMQCGYTFTWDEMEPPKFCPNCGGAVKVVDA